MRTILIAVMLLVLSIGTVQAFEVPPLELDALYLHNLKTGANEAGLTASFQVASVEKIPVSLDVLLLQTFEDFGDFGLGVSTTLKGDLSNLKIGAGYAGGSVVAYIGFKIK